jgi:parallel beta-helix repeat protein
MVLAGLRRCRPGDDMADEREKRQTMRIALVLLCGVLLFALVVATAADAGSPSRDGDRPACEVHPPIRILGDTGPLGLALPQGLPRPGSGVRSGTGTENDPYIIEGWCIELHLGEASEQALRAIQLEDTTAHVVIRANEIRATPLPLFMSTGIRLQSTSNVVVTENQITGTYGGIHLRGTSDTLIVNNTIQAAAHHAILLEGSDRNHILGNEIQGNMEWENLLLDSEHGIYLDQSHDNEVAENRMQNVVVGLFVRSAHDNQMTGNHISYTFNGLDLNGADRATITNNTVHCLSHGLALSRSVAAQVTGNAFDGCGLVLDGTEPSHYAHTMAENLVNGAPLHYVYAASGTTLTGKAGQVILVSSQDITLQHIEVTQVTLGVHVIDSHRVRIENSSIEDNLVGIRAEAKSTRLHVEWSNLAGNTLGIHNIGEAYVQAAQNWWGCEEGPVVYGNAPNLCSAMTGPIEHKPWLEAANPRAGLLDEIPLPEDSITADGLGTLAPLAAIAGLLLAARRRRA